jgi:hypothetical protein
MGYFAGDSIHILTSDEAGICLVGPGYLPANIFHSVSNSGRGIDRHCNAIGTPVGGSCARL